MPPPKIATTEDKLDLHSGKKPILKHRTLSEILTIHQRPSSPVLENLDLTSDDEADHEEDGNGSLAGSPRPGIFHTKSDTNIVRKGSTRRPSPPRIPIPSLAMVGQGGVEHGIPHGQSGTNLAEGGSASAAASPSGGPQEKRHISFNTFVEQCISLDEPTSISPDRPADQGSSDDDSDDDDVLEMRSTASSVSSTSQRPGLSRKESDPKEHFTIAHIAPTLLKSNEKFPAPSPAVIFMPPNASSSALHRSSGGGGGSASSVSSSSPSLESDSDRPSRLGPPGSAADYDFPSPIDQAQWDEDDHEFHDLIKGSSRAPASSGSSSTRQVTGRVGSVNHYESSPTGSPNNSRTDLPSAAAQAAQQGKPPRRGASIGSTPPSSGTTTPTGGPKPSSQPTLPSSSAKASATASSSASSTSDLTRDQPPQSPNQTKQPGRSILKKAGSGGANSASSPKADSYFPDAQSLVGAVESVKGDAGGGVGGQGGFVAVNAPSSSSASAASGASSSATASSAGADTSGGADSEDEGSQRRGRSVSRNSSSSSLVDRATTQSRSASTNPPASPSTNSGHGGASFFNGPPTTGPAAGGSTRAARPPSINTAAASAAPPRAVSPGPTSDASTPGDGSGRDDYWADKVPSPSEEASVTSSSAYADPTEQERIARNAALAREVMQGFDSSFGEASAGQEQSTPFEGGSNASDSGDYVPTESTNPTPHSSPLVSPHLNTLAELDPHADVDGRQSPSQIAMRSLPNSQATSAASLPHSNGPRKASSPTVGEAPGSSPSGAFAALGLNSPPASSTLSGPPSAPKAQQQQTTSSSSSTTTSEPPKANPAAASSGGGGVVETAKGLLGALWGMGGGSAATQTMGHQAHQQSPQNENASRRP